MSIHSNFIAIPSTRIPSIFLLSSYYKAIMLILHVVYII
nr:hypothetical protein TDPV-053 [Oriental turtle dovepox virus]